MGIKILTDSGCDLSKDIIEEYDIDVLPLLVIDADNDEEYLDKVTISEEELYKNMRNGNNYKTAQVPLGMLQEKFEEYASQGQDAIYICFSSGLSGLYQSTKMVKSTVKDEYPNFNIDLVDSKAAASGFGLIVYKAAIMVKEGKSREEILRVIDHYIEYMEHLITVEEMSYLYKGGRIGRVKALAGGLLNIKPIIDIDKDGRLRFVDKIRGERKLYSTLLDMIEERGKNGRLESQIIGISHGDNIDKAIKIKEEIERRFNPKEVLIFPIGASIVAHTGPSILGITFLSDNGE